MTKTEDLRAPLDGVTEGHLVVRRGLGTATMTSDPELTYLMTGHWTGRRMPRAKIHRGTVELTFPRLSLGFGSPAHELRLNDSVPWRIEIDGGVGEVTANLSNLAVHSVDVTGGIADSRIDLPTPEGTLVVRLGSVSDVVVTRPTGVPVRVRVRRGSRDLTVDGQSLGAAGGPTTLADPEFDAASDRIDLVVDAASHLTVTRRS